MTSGEEHTLHVPARNVPVPDHLSPAAQATLQSVAPAARYPALDDKAAWRAYIETANAAVLPMLSAMSQNLAVNAEEHVIGEGRIFVATPETVVDGDRGVVLEMHGGALILCGGEICRIMARAWAARLGRRLWSVDYRTGPDHPYPAALDDCMAAYRALLEIRAPEEIIVSGSSAGGNLAAALILRARDEGLPLPAAAILNTPEIDLTESGDSFHTNEGIDATLHRLMQINLLYADGHDLKDPYLSPLFGDFSKGFPPTILTSGTRDLFLSNTVRMHRALRAAGVDARLHILEAAGHIGFPGAAEGVELDKEFKAFIAEFWP